MSLQIGQRVVVRSPDRREYRGHMIRLQRDIHQREIAVVRLDTGWETSYPLSMLRAEEPARS